MSWFFRGIFYSALASFIYWSVSSYFNFKRSDLEQQIRSEYIKKEVKLHLQVSQLKTEKKILLAQKESKKESKKSSHLKLKKKYDNLNKKPTYDEPVVNDNRDSEELIAQLNEKIASQNKRLFSLDWKLQDLKKEVARKKESNELNGLVEKTFAYTLQPSYVFINLNKKATSSCDANSQKVLDAWFQFLTLYSELDLKNIDLKALALQELPLSHINKLSLETVDKIRLFKPLVKPLLSYYENLKSDHQWQEKLQSIVDSKDNRSDLSALYQLGYPKSDNSCFHSQGSLQAHSMQINYWGNGAILEQWFYTFWLRRYAEGTMDIMHTGLTLIDYLFDELPEKNMPSMVVRKYTDLKNDVNTDGQNSLLNIYKNLIIPRYENYETKIFFDANASLLKHYDLYPFPSTLASKSTRFYRQEEIERFDELSTSIVSYRPKNTTKKSSFYVTEKLTEELNLYHSVPINDSEKKEIEQLLKSTLGWFEQEKPPNNKKCVAGFGTLSSYKNNRDQIFLVQKSCSSWEGEGVRGVYFQLVIARSLNGGFYIKHQYAGAEGNIHFDNRYIADVDLDGNVELFLAVSAGVSSSLSLVELNNNHWQTLRGFIHSYEGGAEEIREAKPNSYLLMNSGV